MEKSPAPVRDDRFWDWSCALLVFLLVQVAAARLLVTGWTPYLYFAGSLGAFGIALGLALGYSRFGRRAVSWLSILYTAAVLPLRLSGTIEVEASLGERLASLGGRLWFSFSHFLSHEPVEDTLFFVTFISLVFWLIGLTGGYHLTRHKNALMIIVPPGLVMLIIQGYDNFVPIRAWGLALFIFLSLVLLGRMYFENNRTVWKKQRIFVANEAAPDIQNNLLLVASAAVLIAWLLPASLSNLQSATRTWDKIARPIRERFSPAVSALESPYGTGVSSEFYGEQLALGRNAALGDMPIFSAKINTSQVDSPPRYYWRGRVYDTYSEGRWSNSYIGSQNFAPEVDELTLPALSGRQEIRATFTVTGSKQGLLYAPAEPYWINRPGRVIAAAAPEQAEDLAAWLAEPVLSAGDRYEVRAMIANPSVEELRAAGTDYPEWITRRYLQIPEDIATRVRELAEQVTIGQTTPYGRISAITTYLRNEIEYSTNLAPLPRNTDPVLWVLFDYKKGFCMYYASAEVMLLRSIGIPARLAVGFAQGTLEDGAYRVLREDSHAWPEVYFPEIGWVEFEPTAIQQPLTRPLTSRTTGTPQDDNGQTSNLPLNPAGGRTGEDRAEDLLEGAGTAPPAFTATPLGRGIIISISLLAVILLVYMNARHGLINRMPAVLAGVYTRSGSPPPPWLERWASWATLTSIEKSFQAINLSLRWLGKPAPLHATAAQRASTLERLLPSAQAEIEILAVEHQSALYTSHAADAARARNASLKIIYEATRARLLKR